MPFEICNVPATFQRLFNTVLSEMSSFNKYLDDLIVYLSSWEDNLISLASAYLTLNLAEWVAGAT